MDKKELGVEVGVRENDGYYEVLGVSEASSSPTLPRCFNSSGPCFISFHLDFCCPAICASFMSLVEMGGDTEGCICRG